MNWLLAHVNSKFKGFFLGVSVYVLVKLGGGGGRGMAN